MNIDDLTLGQAKTLAGLFQVIPAEQQKASAFESLIGENIMIRTVTMIFTGRLVAVYPNELVITNAAWIAVTGRWQQFIADGSVDECEPYPDDHPVIVGRSGLIDATLWRAALPRVQR